MTTGLCVLLRSKWTLTRDWKRTQRWQDDQATKRRLNTRHVETNSLVTRFKAHKESSPEERREFGGAAVDPSKSSDLLQTFDFSSVHT